MSLPSPVLGWLLDWIVIHGSLVAGLAVLLAIVERLSGRRLWPEVSTAGWWAVLLLWLPIALPIHPEAPTLPLPAPTSPLDSAAPATGFAAIGWSVAWIAWTAVWLALQVATLIRTGRARVELLSEALPTRALQLEILEAGRVVGLRRIPRVRVSDRVAMPAVLGAWRPLLILPGELERESADRRHHVLLHELMHLRRRDPVRSWLALQVLLLGWFHPALWWANRRLRSLCEIGCDADVASLLQSSEGYRRTLIAYARRSLEATVAPPGIALGEWDLRHRLERLRWSPRTPRSRRRVGAIGLGFAAWLLLAPRLPIEGREPTLSSPESVVAERDSATDCVAPRTPEATRSASRPPGCLRLRYQVLGALAAARSASAGPDRR